MTKNPIDVALVLIFLYPLIKGFLIKFSSENLKSDIEEVSSYISFIVGAMAGTYLTKRIFIVHDAGIYAEIYNYIPKKIITILEGNPVFIYVLAMPLMIFLVYKIVALIIELINSITFYPLLDGIEDLIKEKNGFLKRIIGLFFQVPKAIWYTLLVTLILNVSAIIGISSEYNEHLDKSVVYSTICDSVVKPITTSKFAQKLPNIINNSFKIVVKNDSSEASDNSGETIVYYNGITLSDGIKSNKEIDQFARELTKNEKTSINKAKIIYDWIGQNIEYDYDKVDKILRNDFSVESGAINTFYSRKGICFDYSCLFSAMCKANNIDVRIITGEGFNGSSWVNHAWNQVYIEEEERWINVDTTFYKGGNYFDSTIFKLDHRNAKIAG